MHDTRPEIPMAASTGVSVSSWNGQPISSDDSVSADADAVLDEDDLNEIKIVGSRIGIRETKDDSYRFHPAMVIDKHDDVPHT